MILVISGGGFFSAEQPGSSVMFRLDIFVWIAARGCALTQLSSCTYGSPLKKPFQFLHNKPWLLELASQCSCRFRGKHFVAQGSFTRENLKVFRERCVPSCLAVFRREPAPGESVARFSGSYPFPLMQRFAAGSAAAKHADIPVLPLTSSFSTVAALADLQLPDLPDSGFEVAARAPFHAASDWVVELASSLPFREALRYRFKANGHINVLGLSISPAFSQDAVPWPFLTAVSRWGLPRKAAPAVLRSVGCFRAPCLTSWAVACPERVKPE